MKLNEYQKSMPPEHWKQMEEIQKQIEYWRQHPETPEEAVARQKELDESIRKNTLQSSR
jgi:hypothetical protein